MQINLARLKLRPQQSEDFYLEAQGNNDFFQGSGAIFHDRIIVDLQVENTGRMFLARGKVKTLLVLPCSRCLQDTCIAIDTDVELTLVPAGQAGKPEPEEDVLVFQGDLVDLRVPVHEAIFMAIPMIPLCHSDCRGLCPVCGKDLNQGPCSCQQKEIDPRWEKLKNL
ncbi:MAG TPA: DUF177 domain-containing protein [Syntrophomonas sp.]|nr:DUF177 domain-containing protein [Syntrophomonas sp.]HRW13526.1 DUF177 domain-containing protein [Syntrophomonas sp.]